MRHLNSSRPLALALLLAVSLIGFTSTAGASGEANAAQQTQAPAQTQKDAGGNSKPTDSKPSDSRPSDSRPSDSRPSDSRPSDSKPAVEGPGTSDAKKDAPAHPPIYAIFDCESGSFRAELATKQAPRLCANFINLVNRGYYDGMPWRDFSRVVRQTGVNGTADPAYTIPRELSKDLLFDKPGRLCYSNNSEDVATARSKPTRIFVTVLPQERWNLQYAVFGVVVEGLDVAIKLKDGEKIIRIRIEGDYKAHQERYAKLIAQWNAELDKVGLVDRR